MTLSHTKWLLVLATSTILAACQPMSLGGDAALSGLSEPERKLYEQASEKRAAGSTEEAKQLFVKAAQLSTGAVEAHVAIAEILRIENKAAESLPMLEDALKLKPEDARLHMEKGFSLISRAQYTPAIASFDTALVLDENLASAYSGKAVAFDLEGKHEQAQMVYAEAVARGFSTPSLDNNYALSLIFSGKYDEAIQLLKPRADAADGTATIRQNLALAYGLKGDASNAQTYSEKDLDAAKVRDNLEFYRRYSALRKQKTGAMQVVPSEGAGVTTATAVPVAPVTSGDVAPAIEQGAEVVLKPNVEVIEMDPEEFEALSK